MMPPESGVHSRKSAVTPADSLTTEQDDPRMVEAVQEYLNALEAGSKPNRQEFLARYADIAEPLAECLGALEFVHMVGPRVEESAGAGHASARRSGTVADLAVPLGDFRILREVGRGGMGVVYEAEQLSLGRRIALKVLPFALTLDPRQLQRFKNEARAAAHLHHTNIVPIYSVGCERGVHFYAMQYVEGQSLAMVIRELRYLAGLQNGPVPGSESGPPLRGTDLQAVLPTPDSQPTGPYVPQPSGTYTSSAALTGATDRSTRTLTFFRSTARLAVQAAEALEHAHQLGVVHRDIKPANLLVDGFGHLWITDFGLAQFQSDAGLTVTGDVVGTLRYMSPEQALAKRKLVDHRTDVYSLGATLYELLTLVPPFGGRDREELLRQITFEEPSLPRQLNPSIPIDLETIVLKALAKAPEERYATAQELGDDLKRFLEDKPILARRPTLLEHTAKWCRRHRPVVASVIVLLVMAFAGLAAFSILIAREQARTKAAYEAEAKQRRLAEESFLLARQAVDFLTGVTKEELADYPELEDVRRVMLEAARRYYQGFIDLRGDDPTLRAELAESELSVATILNQTGGSQSEALAALERALYRTERLVRDNPDVPEYQRIFTTIYYNLDWLRLGGRLYLLSQKSVQEDMKLADEQVKKVDQVRGERFRGPREFSHLEYAKRLADLPAQERALADLLRPEQVQRLQQIILRQKGLRAFSDSDVVRALHLSADQKDKIRVILAEAGPNWRDPRISGGPRPLDLDRRTEEWNKVRDKILDVLTEEQRQRWQATIGEPFKGELRPAGPGGPGGLHHPQRSGGTGMPPKGLGGPGQRSK